MTADAPQYVATRIKQRLAQDDRTTELGIQVDVRGGEVFLRGQVASEERRRLIAEVAHEVDGSLHVHNEVTVVEARDPTEEERFA